MRPPPTFTPPAVTAAAEAVGIPEIRPVADVDLAVEAAQVRGTPLIAIWRAVEPEVAGEIPVSGDPDVVAAMTAALTEPASPDDALRLGWLIGVIRDRYLYGGWIGEAIAAVTGAPFDGDRVTDEIAQAARYRFVERLAARLGAIGPVSALARLGRLPGARRIAAARAQVRDAARRLPPAVDRFEGTLGEAAWLAGGPPPGALALGRRPDFELPEDPEVWIDGDALAPAKAVGRVAGVDPSWFHWLEETRRRVAGELQGAAAAAWAQTVARARAGSLGSAPARGIDGLLRFGEACAARAVGRIALGIAECRRGAGAPGRVIEHARAAVSDAATTRDEWQLEFDAYLVREAG